MAAGDQQLAPPSGKAASARDTVIHLPQLQNLIKRDPVSYREDFLRQFRHFQSNLDILRLNPAHDVKHFGDLVLFLSHVC